MLVAEKIGRGSLCRQGLGNDLGRLKGFAVGSHFDCSNGKSVNRLRCTLATCTAYSLQPRTQAIVRSMATSVWYVTVSHNGLRRCFRSRVC